MRKFTLVGSTATVFLLSSMLVLAPGSGAVLGELGFKEWYTSTMNRIEADATTMATGVENFDCMGVEAGARSGSEAATAALDQLEGYEVSPEMQPVKEHLKLALEDFKAACIYAETGAMNRDPNDFKTAARYVNTSRAHLESIDKLGLVSPAPEEALKRLQDNLELAAQLLSGTQPTPSPTPSPTPKAPGYGAILAVSSLVLVLYGVRRRAN